jgi:hypothetical protein
MITLSKRQLTTIIIADVVLLFVVSILSNKVAELFNLPTSALVILIILCLIGLCVLALVRAGLIPISNTEAANAPKPLRRNEEHNRELKAYIVMCVGHTIGILISLFVPDRQSLPVWFIASIVTNLLVIISIYRTSSETKLLSKLSESLQWCFLLFLWSLIPLSLISFALRVINSLIQ